jgi:hypothetical protein
MRRTFLLMPLLVLLAPQLQAADLTKIERSIRKEPTYQSKTPRYCLLVFGPEATTRVWLVLDGKTLFVDRNGNGDLTDDSKKVIAKEGSFVYGEDGEIVFDIGAIQDGPRLHKKIALFVRKIDYLAVRDADVKAWLASTPQARGLSMHAEVEMPGWKGDGIRGRAVQAVSFRDSRGFLTFADKPGEAPVIHFGGPWTVTVSEPHRLVLGREQDLFLRVGTPGLGAGTFAAIAYEGVIPERCYPRVEITYPPKIAGERPVKMIYELKERC